MRVAEAGNQCEFRGKRRVIGNVFGGRVRDLAEIKYCDVHRKAWFHDAQRAGKNQLVDYIVELATQVVKARDVVLGILQRFHRMNIGEESLGLAVHTGKVVGGNEVVVSERTSVEFILQVELKEIVGQLVIGRECAAIVCAQSIEYDLNHVKRLLHIVARQVV